MLKEGKTDIRSLERSAETFSLYSYSLALMPITFNIRPQRP